MLWKDLKFLLEIDSSTKRKSMVWRKRKIHFQVFLNRKQSVRNGINESDRTVINLGVPQGTEPGTLIFRLYVNDFSEERGKNSSVLRIADDTATLCHKKKYSIQKQRLRRY